MFENIMKFFRKMAKKEELTSKSKDTAKERLHLVLMQDRANVSADFLDLMRQEIIDVIKKYIEVDESAIDVRLTNKENADGTNGAPALYANIPIVNIKEDAKKLEQKENKDKVAKSQDNKQEEAGKAEQDKKEVEKSTKEESKENEEENKTTEETESKKEEKTTKKE